MQMWKKLAAVIVGFGLAVMGATASAGAAEEAAQAPAVGTVNVTVNVVQASGGMFGPVPPGMHTAVLASEGDVIDVFMALPFAKLKNASMIATPKEGVDEAVIKELRDKGLRDVYLVGGMSGNVQAIESHLAAQGFNVARITGMTRFDTGSFIQSHAAGALPNGLKDIPVFYAANASVMDLAVASAAAARQGGVLMPIPEHRGLPMDEVDPSIPRPAILYPWDADLSTAYQNYKYAKSNTVIGSRAIELFDRDSHRQWGNTALPPEKIAGRLPSDTANMVLAKVAPGSASMKSRAKDLSELLIDTHSAVQVGVPLTFNYTQFKDGASPSVITQQWPVSVVTTKGETSRCLVKANLLNPSASRAAGTAVETEFVEDLKARLYNEYSSQVGLLDFALGNGGKIDRFVIHVQDAQINLERIIAQVAEGFKVSKAESIARSGKTLEQVLQTLKGKLQVKNAKHSLDALCSVYNHLSDWPRIYTDTQPSGFDAQKNTVAVAVDNVEERNARKQYFFAASAVTFHQIAQAPLPAAPAK